MLSNSPLDREGLCILSFDGGGVRGLSSLLILKALMGEVNAQREKGGRDPVKPCQIFDMIGGTSTGGIIAIMLGRLEMDVEECITIYKNMFEKVFAKKGRLLGVTGKIKGRFDSTVLKGCIGNILTERGLSESELMNPGKQSQNKCKVVVCAKVVEMKSTTALFRSYPSRNALQNDPVTISEAALATSAATSFFDPVIIHGRSYTDGGLGANNPVDHIWIEAGKIFCEDPQADLGSITKCFVSIGTGQPSMKSADDKFYNFFKETLVSIATETEQTARNFLDSHRQLYVNKRYYRFNVQQGLQGVGLQEYKAAGLIDTATVGYMENGEVWQAAVDCAQNLMQKQFHRDFSATAIVKWNVRNKLSSNGKPPVTHIPFERNADFVTRDDTFEALDRIFDQPDGPIKIWGLGGCGKTQVVAEYAFRRQDETGCSIFWTNANSEATFTRDYSEISRIANISPELKGEELLHSVKIWIEQQRNWILVLDNADDSSLFESSTLAAEQIGMQTSGLLCFVPKSRTGTVIWTTRDADLIKSVISPSRAIEVGVMTIEESCELFQGLSGLPGEELILHQAKMMELLESLERLPLAIGQAAAYIKATGVSIQQYLEFYQTSEFRQSRLLRHEVPDPYMSEVPNSVMLTWLVSMERIAKESPGSIQILRTIAFFDDKGLPFDLIKAAVDSDVDILDILVLAGRLCAYAFIHTHRTKDEHFPQYGQHRLVQLAIRQSLSAKEASTFSGVALRIISTLFPEGNYETWNACRLYLPHALKAVQHEDAEDFRYRAPRLLQNIGMFYWEQGCSEDAERVEIKVLGMLESSVGSEDPATIKAMENLSGTWHQQGRLKEALEMDEKVLESRRRLGETHPYTITAKANLATTLHHQGQFGRAEKLREEVRYYQDSLQDNEELNSMTLIAMSNLASTWWQQGRINEAEQLRRRVHDLRKEALGEEHPDTMKAMANHAVSLCQQSNYQKAAEIQRQVLALQRKVLGKEHPHTITTMANLASTIHHQGALEEVEELQMDVLILRKKLLRESHPDTIKAMANLAATKHQLGEHKAAEEQEIQVLNLRVKELGDKHPDTITAMANLAATIGQQPGRLDEVESYEMQVLQLQTEVLGHNHPDTITAMANLAVTYLQQGKLEMARERQIEVIGLRREVLGLEHAHTRQAERDLGLIDRELSQKRGKFIDFISLESCSQDIEQGTVKTRGRWKSWEEKLIRWRKYMDH